MSFSFQSSAFSDQSSRCSAVAHRRNFQRAFTLIELLAVIAIVGILAAILVPTLGSARNSASKARTRTQFSQWAAAFEAFRQEYGAYPQFPTAVAQKVVNPAGTSTNTGQVHLFHDTLTGHRRDPSIAFPTTNVAVNGVPPPQQQNARRIPFVSFTDADFVTAADVTAGSNTNAQLNYVRDAFHNTSIAVVTDTNLDGIINGIDAATMPAVTVVGATTTITPRTNTATGVNTGRTGGGIHAGVIFYSAPPGASADTDLIMSWK